jgi:L-asparaginase II
VSCEPAARVYRGVTVEAEHRADVAVVDADGNLTHYVGNPDAVYMTRSSLKPLQALPLILTGGFDRFGFDRRHLAVMCASHSGTDEHVAVVCEALAKAGNSPDDLQCGAGWPLYFQFEGMHPPVKDDQFGSLRSDCSGKHAGFLALVRHLGEPTSEYLNPDSRAQQMIKQTVAQACEYPVEKIATGIDGCSAPNFSLPVKNLAIGFKNLALAHGSDDSMCRALRRVFEAMTTELGAESIQGLGLTDPKIGIAVKVTDGAIRALGPICLRVLRELGIVTSLDRLPFLKPYERPVVRNARGIETGRIVVDFTLRKA